MIFKTLLVTFSLFIAAAASATDQRIVLTSENVVTMNTEFNSESVAKITQQIREMDSQLKTNVPIFLVMYSPGGSIDAGIELIENLQNMNRPIHTLTLFAASMGFHTVQGLGQRLITRNGTLMSHKAKGVFAGEFPGQLDTRYRYYLKRVGNLDKDVVARTNGKHTKKSYSSLIIPEYWCDGQDCVDQGFADKVVRATCNKSLSGTKNEDLKFNFAGISITVRMRMASCPLTTGVISYEILTGEEKLSAMSLPIETVKAINEKVQTLVTNKFSKEIVLRY